MKPSIMTQSGSYFNFENPHPDSFSIDDIAYALSNICRYGGHCRPFYSVAQHSVYVSHLVPEEHALFGLLHDAGEAFVGDIPSPLKQLLPEYKAIEKKVESAVFDKFGINATDETKKIIKEADIIALRSEREVLLPKGNKGDAWWWVEEQNIPISDKPVVPISSTEAYFTFLSRFEELAYE